MDTCGYIKSYLKESGRNMVWLSKKMKELDPSYKLDNKKISASLNNNRCLSADEFLLMCRALEVNPDVFYSPNDKTA